MAISDVLVRIRKEQGLTQDDLARKLFVTRQAVSRWENVSVLPTRWLESVWNGAERSRRCQL